MWTEGIDFDADELDGFTVLDGDDSVDDLWQDAADWNEVDNGK